MDLDELRRELAAIDRELIEALARRHAAASAIGRAKRALGRPLRDFRQERVVVQRARAAAEELGVPGQVAEELALLLIRSSLTTQERDQVSAGRRGSGKRALVVGGRGRMGGWFVRFLASQGYAVEVADPAGPVPGYDHHDSWRDSDLDHDLVVVAAPIRDSRTILEQLAECPPRGLILDVGSLKSPLRPALEALVRSGARVASLHPMFGPDTDLLSGRHVIFVDVGMPEAADQARELFASTMATRIDMDLDGHDRLIAYVLGLSHALNIAFFTALAASGESAPGLKQISSTTFDLQLRIADSVAAENPHLYYEIQALNEFGDAALGSLGAALDSLRSIVRSGDEAGFVALMRQGREYLGALRDA